MKNLCFGGFSVKKGKFDRVTLSVFKTYHGRIDSAPLAVGLCYAMIV